MIKKLMSVSVSIFLAAGALAVLAIPASASVESGTITDDCSDLSAAFIASYTTARVEVDNTNRDKYYSNGAGNSYTTIDETTGSGAYDNTFIAYKMPTTDDSGNTIPAKAWFKQIKVTALVCDIPKLPVDSATPDADGNYASRDFTFTATAGITDNHSQISVVPVKTVSANGAQASTAAYVEEVFTPEYQNKLFEYTLSLENGAILPGVRYLRVVFPKYTQVNTNGIAYQAIAKVEMEWEHDETNPYYNDPNLFEGEVPKDPDTGRIPLTVPKAKGSQITIFPGEISVLAARIALPPGATPNYSVGEGFGTNGNFGIKPGSNQYDQGQVYLQFDYGASTRVDMFRVTSKEYDHIPKRFRVDYSVDGQTWVQGTERTKDLSSAADVGLIVSEAYGRLLAGGSDAGDTNIVNSLLTTEYIFEQPINARAFRYVILEPSQKGNSVGTLIIRDPAFYDLSIPCAEAELDSNVVIPFTRYGEVDFTANKSEVSLNTAEDTSKKRFSYLAESVSSDMGNMAKNNTDTFSLKGNGARFVVGNQYIAVDLGKNQLIDRIDVTAFVGNFGAAGSLPKNIRVDDAVLDEYDRPSWRIGTEQICDESLLAADAREKTTSTRFLELTNPRPARFYRIVFLEPQQTTDLTASIELKIRRIQLYDSDKIPLTYDWDEATRIKNVYASGMIGKSGQSMFDGDTNISGSESPNLAFDSNDSTQWFSANVLFTESSENSLERGWIVVDLGSPHQITGFNVLTVDYNMATFDIMAGELMDDPAGATHAERGVAIITQTFSPVQEGVEMQSSGSNYEASGSCDFVARYVKLMAKTGNTPGDVKVREIALYSKKTSKKSFSVAEVTVTSTDGAYDLIEDGMTNGLTRVTAVFDNQLEDKAVHVFVAVYKKGQQKPDALQKTGVGKKVIAKDATGDDAKITVDLEITNEDDVLKVFILNTGTLRPADNGYSVVTVERE